MNGRILSLADYGMSGLVIDIECVLSNNLPNIVIVGFGNRAVDESKERIRGAFASSGLQLPRKRITINLAPSDIPKGSSSFDLPIAAAILHATGTLKRTLGPTEALMGELSLDGSLRPVRGVIGKILAGRSRGIKTFYIPEANTAQARLVPDVALIPLANLKQLYDYLTSTEALPRVETGAGRTNRLKPTPHEVTFADIVGQESAKRALEIAAAGGHNVLLNGAPGTGKSLLARALTSILPPLSIEEMLEVTHLHSLAGKEYRSVIEQPPVRAPHHTASHVSVIGGGSSLRPGEVSLAHNGVLLFDEFPEFSRPTIESLRQPLENHTITITRARDSYTYPSRFIFVATANPCPCGFYGTEQNCECTASAIQRYRSKLSGPILDRIDLYCSVGQVRHQELLNNRGSNPTNVVRNNRIYQARQHQKIRFKCSKLNTEMSNQDIRSHARMTKEAKQLLDTAAANLGLSARAYMRSIKVARTIADLAESKTIELPHISEAISYRSRP